MIWRFLFVCLFVCLLVCSFVPSFVRSFVRSFVCLFVGWFVRAFVRSFVCLLVGLVGSFLCLVLCSIDVLELLQDRTEAPNTTDMCVCTTV